MEKIPRLIGTHILKKKFFFLKNKSPQKTLILKLVEPLFFFVRQGPEQAGAHLSGGHLRLRGRRGPLPAPGHFGQQRQAGLPGDARGVREGGVPEPAHQPQTPIHRGTLPISISNTTFLFYVFPFVFIKCFEKHLYCEVPNFTFDMCVFLSVILT